MVNSKVMISGKSVITSDGKVHTHGDYKFYGRRKNKYSNSNLENIVDTTLPDLELKKDDYLNNNKWFSSSFDKLWLEIGFGGGEHLAFHANNNTDIGFIGAEPFLNGVGSLIYKLNDKNNVRIIPDDVRDFLELTKSDIFDRIFLLYPDPWPKTKHNSRRFINDINLNNIARILKKGGVFRFVSDHEDYTNWMLHYLLECPFFKWSVSSCKDWNNSPSDWFSTRYEQKAKKEDRVCNYFDFVKT